MTIEFPPIRYVVEGFIAEGLTLFAGAPKIGKSWWALNVAHAIASGELAFGSVDTESGDVLYLALEDNPRRLQGRLKKMGVTHGTNALTICTDWPTFENGAVKEIEAWSTSVENPTLVIVDVLARIRDDAGARDISYDSDYRMLADLQELAGQSNLAIVAMHHTRKMPADDPFDSVSGTRGLTGAADTCLVLQRNKGDRRTVLYGRGRDIPESETAFEFEQDSGTWRVLGDISDVGKTKERDEILIALRSYEDPMTAQQVADTLNKSLDSIRRTLNRMANDGEVEKPERGRFAYPKCPKVPSKQERDNETDETVSRTWGLPSGFRKVE